MPKVKGNLVAVRPRSITTRGNTITAYQAAYIPQGDDYGFPAVINITAEVFGQLSDSSGAEVELTYIETPPYGDKLVTLAAQ